MIRLEAMSDQRVVAGKNVRFLCGVAEGDGVILSWTFGGQLLPSSGDRAGKYRVIGGDTESILVINSVAPTDAGFYSCVGKTPHSESRVSAQLSVEGYLISCQFFINININTEMRALKLYLLYCRFTFRNICLDHNHLWALSAT